MKLTLLCIIVLSLLCAAPSAMSASYAYFSDIEDTFFGGPAPGPFTNPDTLWGSLRTNDCFECADNSAVFYGSVIMSCDSSSCLDSAEFLGPPPTFGAVQLPFPENADQLRNSDYLFIGHHFQTRQDARAVVRIESDYMDIWWGTQGVPLFLEFIPFPDVSIPLTANALYFFECPIRIAGTLAPDFPHIIFASSGDIGLDDDLVLAESTNDHHTIPQTATSSLALVAEGNIVVMNTWANGRNNQERGSDILIHAYLVALNESFTFRQRNDDEEDTYIFPGGVDLRGSIFLTGVLVQRRSAYLYLPNNEGTGFDMNFVYDSRLDDWSLDMFAWEPPAMFPTELDFGEVVVGETLWDSVLVTPVIRSNYSGTFTTPPFGSPPLYLFNVERVRVPVSFSPTQARTYNEVVYFYLSGTFNYFNVRGIGVNPPPAQGFKVSVQPNPFNAVTTLSLNLPQAGDVNIILYDILGREAERLNYTMLPSGPQTIRLDMSQYASGVYFARLHSGANTATHKLLLMK